jgi:hypothetical protein
MARDSFAVPRSNDPRAQEQIQGAFEEFQAALASWVDI